MDKEVFQKMIWDFYEKNGRHDLPWRNTQNLYDILVSELMLQQTQVSRVLPKYTEWIARYPNFKTLAESNFIDVLQMWQGLGFQRRAKYLYQIAGILKNKTEKELRKMTVEELDLLPGVGPYTASAIHTFVSDAEEIFIETNIRTIFIHHFFSDQKNIKDEDILQKIKDTLPQYGFREWYFALMDYGAHLKVNGIKNNIQSASYTKQSKFIGSNRQVRGQILKSMLETHVTTKIILQREIGTQKDALIKALLELEKEGFIVISGETVSLRSKLQRFS